MYYGFAAYTSVAEKQKKAQKVIEKLRKRGHNTKPITHFKGKMAATFWGKSWCENLEAYADYENRLERGRSYVRSGSVCHLEITQGTVEALVNGSKLYSLTININPLAETHWRNVCESCAGRIGSLLELLQGTLSRHVMEAVCHPQTGLFPSPDEISFNCSCPDWASMCKHVAAVMYGIGRRLDTEPELLFTLRGVNGADLVPAQLDFATAASDNALHSSDLGALFGIDLDMHAEAAFITTADPGSAAVNTNPVPRPRAKKKSKTPPKTKKQVAPKVKKIRPPFNAKRPTGAAIYKLRKCAGLSQQEFADAVSITLLTLQRWEQNTGVGTNALSLRTASKERLSSFQESLLRSLQQ